MGGVGGRWEPAHSNFLETFPYFVAAVVVVTISGQADRVSFLGGAIALFRWAGSLYSALRCRSSSRSRAGLEHTDPWNFCDVRNAIARRKLRFVLKPLWTQDWSEGDWRAFEDQEEGAR